MIVDCAHYRDGERQHEHPLTIAAAAEIARAERAGEFVWVGLRDPGDEELELVEREFSLNPLAAEDTRHAHQRPKLEDYDESVFVVLRPARYLDEREEVEFGEIHLFLAGHYAIVIRRGEPGDLGPARRRLEDSQLLRHGVAAVAWAVLDKVVDDYAPVVAGIDDDIEEVEQEIFFQHGTDATQRIYFLKREVIEFNRAVAPLLPFLEALERGGIREVDEELRRYFRDVADHARRIDDRVNAQRELLTSILEANLALLSVTQNESVRAISAWAAIIAVPTFLSSIWGMNFTHMPELNETWAYPAALGTMAVAVVSLYRFFRRIRWL
ncbi:MAG TPA: magnesium and cobalt transport protein CorA [Solirubrobacterales bacterium]|nr:magnesium and cobalt transport protein CorA [Solirubrobacterales bacterium]